MVAADRFVVGRDEAQKIPDSWSSRLSALFGCFVPCTPSNSKDTSYAGERQSKPTTCIPREIYNFTSKPFLTNINRCGKRGNNVTPFHCARVRTPPPRHRSTPIPKLALVQARPEDINIGPRHPVTNEQAAYCKCLVQATSRTRRRHDANPRVHDILHKTLHNRIQ